MSQFRQQSDHPRQSSPANTGEPRFLEQVANACRVKHLAYRAVLRRLRQAVYPVSQQAAPEGNGADGGSGVLDTLGREPQGLGIDPESGVERHRVHVP
jgi:hypothetical protein